MAVSSPCILVTVRVEACEGCLAQGAIRGDTAGDTG